MNNFRKEEPRRGQRQAIDGIISAPNRPQLTKQAFDRRSLSSDSFRTTNRTIGDFKRPAGYHMANSAAQAPIGDRPQAAGPKLKQPEAASPLQKSLSDHQRHRFGRRKHLDKSKRGKRNWRKIALRGGLATLAILILLGGFLFAKGFFKVNKVFKGGGSAAALNSEVDPSKLKGEGDGRVNILMMGRGGEGHAGADLTDTILVASIDPVNNKAALVSIPRDFWVTTSGGSTKINAVFANTKQKALNQGKNKKDAEAAGIKAVQAEVKDILGITTHYYGMVDFKAFQQAVDTVGGVDITVTEKTAVTEKLWNEVTGKNYYLNVQPGKQHFDGLRALFYARSRHASPRGDFDRAERQRLMIEALSKKITSAGTYTNPVKISQLMDAFGDHVSMDMSVNDAMRLMQIGKKIGGNFESVDLADPAKPLVRTGMVGGQSVVVPVAGTSDYSEIQTVVRSKLKDGYILKENANITVLNGTVTPGLAGEKADELKTYGYNVGTVADAPTSTYEKTVIIDLNKSKKKPYTKNYLEKRFGVKATTKLPDTTIQAGNANFVIILGRNETINR